MYIRFGAGILLVVAISVAGVAIEKEILSSKRELSHQAYREEVLLERHHHARMRVEELSSPDRILKATDQNKWSASPSRRSSGSVSRTASGDSEIRVR